NAAVERQRLIEVRHGPGHMVHREQGPPLIASISGHAPLHCNVFRLLMKTVLWRSAAANNDCFWKNRCAERNQRAARSPTLTGLVGKRAVNAERSECGSPARLKRLCSQFRPWHAPMPHRVASLT